ncbi:hypothetical protein GBA52_001931 [Prunus armeniaca]|nr:hypothetical protein GBA52_001931 [Prunus armeniaca]
MQTHYTRKTRQTGRITQNSKILRAIPQVEVADNLHSIRFCPPVCFSSSLKIFFKTQNQRQQKRKTGQCFR